MILRLEILANAVDDLYRLGWLDGADHRVDAAVVGSLQRPRTGLPATAGKPGKIPVLSYHGGCESVGLG
jgi:hypothetical protein